MGERTSRIRFEARWWSRWLVRHLPGAALARVRHCRRGHRGPLLDGQACMTCKAPWLRSSLR